MSEQKKTKVAVTTLGCKVNQFESAAFLSELEMRGVEVVPFARIADIYIINTCTVTARAAAQSRQMIRRALKTNGQARVVVTGCYSQVAATEVMELADWAVCIVGNGHKHRLVDIALSDKQCDIEMHLGDIASRRTICPLTPARFPGRTRAYLKLQDGCNNFCSYCIVPYARGRSRSLDPAAALAQIALFVAAGHREIVLTGIHVGMYGLDLSPRTELTDFIGLATSRFPDVRFRLSSLEPNEIGDDLLDLMAARENFMPHLHIPLQSGDDAILRAMNRRYSAADFASLVERIRVRIPAAAIGVDVLVGFPGETEEAFAATAALLAKLPVTYLHVFPYSRRPGTMAAGMDKQIPGPEKERRVAELRRLDQKKRAIFYRRHLGETHLVLAENRKNRFRLMRGFTENYIPVLFPALEKENNTLIEVRLERLEEGIVFGQRL
ncbi:MAG: tRNA (N(6)-L-threonylcarbamoyladenosine(37)-C(2))-methylthiotransferase MtaB [Thermodesulfobacteriota bacterium]